jgi:hypothetical protein
MSHDTMTATAIGFTGTQHGLTLAQEASIRNVLTFSTFSREARVFHHGDCVGADDTAAGIVESLGYRIECHPPVNPLKRAFTKSYDVTRPELPYLKRNDAIVAAATRLVAAPRAPEDHPNQRRSGTWYTVRRARKKGIEVIICWPDGTVTREAERLPVQEELLT